MQDYSRSRKIVEDPGRSQKISGVTSENFLNSFYTAGYNLLWVYFVSSVKLSHDLRLKVAFMLLFLKKEHLSMLLARNYEAIEDC